MTEKTVVLPPKDRERDIAGLAKYLAACSPGKPVRVRVSEARPDRTPKQNSYLWAVPYKLLSEHTGMEPEELHEWNCGAQWGWKDKKRPKTPRNPEGFESVPVRTTTTNEDGERDLCSRDEMCELWARAQKLGAGFDIIIPDPDKDWWRHLK